MSVKIDWRNECEGIRSRAEYLLKKEKFTDCQFIKSRAVYLLKNEKFTDCQFIVGQESDKAVIRAHKVHLAVASPVFERMFYGRFDDEKSDEIRIPDIKHNIFRKMLVYSYCEKLELETEYDAMELYSAANKYMLKDLMGSCIGYLLDIKRTQIPKLWEIYEFAVSFQENVLMTKAADAMAYNAKAVLKDPSFVNAKFTTLIALFERDALNIDSELDLFHGLEKYALANGYFDTKNDVENKEAVSEKQKLLGEALKKIRKILCLTVEQFEVVARSALVSSGLLTDSEVLSILGNIIYPN